MTADPTRRAVLAAAAGLPLLITGCKGVGALEAIPKPPADVILLRAATSAEQLMVARYEAAIRVLRGSQGNLPSALLPLLAQHREHLAQLRSRLIVPAAGGGGAIGGGDDGGGDDGGRGGATAGPTGRGRPGPRLPAAPDQAIAYLQAAERDASARLMRQVLAAPASLAELLASIAASEATHVPALKAVRRPG